MKRIIVLSFLSFLFCGNIYAQDRILLDRSKVKQRETIIFMKQDKQGAIYYQDINGRIAIPQGDSFVINIAPGIKYTPSSKKITLINEVADPIQHHNLPNNNQYTYDSKTDPQIGIGYFLGNVVGRK
jgi:hypothetical protein